MKKIDMSNRQVGRLTVLEEVGSTIDNHARWRCQCACGKEVVVSGRRLRNGETASCGCLRTEQLVIRSVVHKKCRTPTYRSWGGILQRCTNSRNPRYAYYGGRGIKVCEPWMTFTQFLADMGECPAGYSIERKNVNGDYEPNNCCWLPKRLQPRNTRKNHRITVCGITKCLAEWRELLCMGKSTYDQRTRRYGMTPVEALTTPIAPRRLMKGGSNAAVRETQARFLAQICT